MKTKTKALALALCAVLLVATTVFVTVAYLTSKDSVTNTFTVGNVKIELWEYDVDAYGGGVGSNPEPTKANEYKLIPGHTYIKNPTVIVDTDSEDCWVFVKVENGIANIEDNTIAAQIENNNWTLVQGETNIYAYNIKASAEAVLPVFNTFKVKDTETADTLSAYENKTIVVTAYAVQADGFDTAAEAWEATKFDF